MALSEVHLLLGRPGPFRQLGRVALQQLSLVGRPDRLEGLLFELLVVTKGVVEQTVALGCFRPQRLPAGLVEDFSLQVGEAFQTFGFIAVVVGPGVEGSYLLDAGGLI